MPRLDTPPASSRDAPNWAQLSATWPDAHASQFWRVRDFIWHVQHQGRGNGPKVLFIHGTGAATHSYAPLVAQMGKAFETVSIDLPGHGFTQSPRGFRPSLTNVSAAIGRLCQEMQVMPDIVVGHSAGAAIAIKLTTEGQIAPRLLVSVNGALRPFEGMMKHVAPTTAKLAMLGGVAARMVSRNSASEDKIRGLVRNIGSDPDRVDTKSYTALLGTPGHVQGALKMMANWDLTGVMDTCRDLDMPALFIAGGQDRAVSPYISKEAAGLAPNGSYIKIGNAGHLGHEEATGTVERAIANAWEQAAL